ncbi:MAG TPA: hypothetical protein VH307_04185 [Streptosporangiaceae bacterium]|nr:hypothetical protein [Streptosporangiaceae bacterium]
MAVAALVVTSASPARQAAGAAPSASAAPGISPSAAPRAPSRYRVAGSVTMKPSYLDCITESVCYAWFAQLASSGVAKPSERTSDGGVTWQELASLPDGQVLNDMVEPSCPAVSMCVAVTQRGALAITSDGGASWRLDPLPAAAGSEGWIDQVSCATERECVVHISGGLTRGAFLSTTNGGLSWTAATRLSSGAPGSLNLLRCDQSGRCIGAVSAGQGTAYVPGKGPGVVVMRSADHGLTWSVSDTANVPPKASSVPGFLMSCGDAVHCLYAGGSGVAITSDGGITWQQPATPAAWRRWTITSVSCPEGLDCSVALAPALASQLPVIQTTSDGTTWTPQALPSSGYDPLQYVTLLSCPAAGACAGLASTLSQEKSEFLRSGGFSSGIVQTSPQLVISSLDG